MKRTWRDPFLEHVPLPHTAMHHVLGLPVQFAANKRWLMRLADRAFAGLPAMASGTTEPLRVKLLANGDLPRGTFVTAPLHRQYSNGDVLAAIFSQADAMLCAPSSGSALVSVSDAMRPFPYHVRCEMIEHAAYLLAAHALGAVPLHAGCIARDAGEGLILFGPSGAGKSTLTFACLTRGWRLISEDGSFLMLQPRLCVRGAPNFVHLLEDANRFFDKSLLRGKHIVRRSGRSKLEIDARRHFGTALCVEAPITRLVFIEQGERTKADGPTVRRLTSAQTRTRLIRQQPFASSHPEWSRAVELLCQLPSHTLCKGGDAHSSAALLERL